MEIEESTNKILIEGEMNFRQGLSYSGYIERIFFALHEDTLVVYTDRSKAVKLFSFKAKSYKLSAISNHQDESLFILQHSRDSKDSNVFLFQVGDENLHDRWLNYFKQCHWDISALQQSRYQHYFRQRTFDPSQKRYGSLHLNNSVHLNSHNLEMSQTEVDPEIFRISNSPTLMHWDIQMGGSIDVNNYDILHKTEDSSVASETTTTTHNNMVTEIDDSKSNDLNSSNNNKLQNDNMFDNIFDERGIYQEVLNNNQLNCSHEYQDPEITPKLDKKPSVSQLLSNIKSKFGSTAARKQRAKKNAEKRSTGDEHVYSSRLLWNHNGEWIDGVFSINNGILAAYKDSSSTKLLCDMEIDVRECAVSVLNNNNNNIFQRMHLIKLETKEELVHLFMAWNFEDYERWIESFNSFVELKDQSFDFQFKNVYNNTEEEMDGDIIPYDHSVAQQKTTSSSSETSVHARIDSIDSGNDGDESGLESSLSSNKKLLETRKKLEKERKTRGLRSSSFNETLETNDKPSIDLSEFGAKHNIKKLEIKRQLSRESTSTENDVRSPTLEQAPDLLNTSSESAFIKKKRNSFIQKKWTFFESKSKKIDLLEVAKSPSSISVKEDLFMDAHRPLTPCSTDGQFLRRPNSLDISSVDNLSVSTWDGFETPSRYKKLSMCSEDGISDTCSVPSIIDDKSQEDLEESLREETLLRKRRNSLTLERSQISSKLHGIRECSVSLDGNDVKPGKKQSKHALPKERTFDQQNDKMTVLVQKLENINVELEDIDKRLYFHRIEMIHNNVDNKTNDITTYKKTTATQMIPINKLNNRPRWTDNNNSISVESLSSIASKESKDRNSAMKKKLETSVSPSLKQQKISHFIRLSDSSESSGGNSHSSGIEELLMTTQRLESSSSVTTPTQHGSSSPTSTLWRSKSLGAMELLKSKPDSKDDVNENTNAELIIEDFEKFSEMLTNQMKMHQTINGPPLHV